MIATKLRFGLESGRRGLDSVDPSVPRASRKRRSCPRSRNSGIGFVPFGPPGKGFLTGKIDENNARKANLATPAQIALAWLLARKPWIVPIPGTRRKLHRLEGNITAAGIELTPDDLHEIEEAQVEARGARYAEANQRMIDR